MLKLILCLAWLTLAGIAQATELTVSAAASLIISNWHSLRAEYSSAAECLLQLQKN